MRLPVPVLLILVGVLLSGVLLVGLPLASTLVTRPATTLVVTDERGALRWQVPVTEGGEVVLQYTNSIYRAPTWERFVVRDSRFRLMDVSSTREAVLEYHRLPAPYLRRGDRLVAPVNGVVLPVIALRVGERGHPILRVRHQDGDQVLPLYSAGVGAGLRVALRRAAAAQAWWKRIREAAGHPTAAARAGAR